MSISLFQLPSPLQKLRFSNQIVDINKQYTRTNDLVGAHTTCGFCIMDLNNNKLSGAIPDALRDLTSLQFLGLQFNQLSGAIPDALGDLTSRKLFTRPIIASTVT